ncbi:MAG: DPP IV N-terminal domain-containing protein [Chloroflexi bacterium]|nr:DPP IV N-terminal domain-containing protein [Chloroflexota bacterium]
MELGQFRFALDDHSFEFVDGLDAIRFDVDGVRWSCDLDSYGCERTGADAAGEGDLLSPDGRRNVIVRDHDIYVRSTNDGSELRLTHDGRPYHDYATRPESYTSAVTDRLSGKTLEPLAAWSPDSRKLVTHRLDQREVDSLHLVQSVGVERGPRPVLHSYRYALVGDEHVPVAEMVILDTDDATRVESDCPPVLCPLFSPFQRQRVWWSVDGSRVYFLDQDRDFKSLRLMALDANSGACRVLIEDRAETPLDPNLSEYLFGRPNVRDLSKGEIVWFSQRDGWGHLYLYDDTTGALKNRITGGDWVVRDILHVDESDREVFFTGGGRETGRNPYYRHLYRASLDGSDVELLTPEHADHEISFAPDGLHFFDTYSRVDSPPVSVLRARDGTLVCELERADVAALYGLGWTAPEPFTVKGADGHTDLYGMFYHPSDFDPDREYPVVEHIYPGPQHLRTPQGFRHVVEDGARALAELGFIVVTIDGVGTPLRSKAFLDESYGRLETAGGLADHVAGLGRLAAERPYMDLDRVGIFGHSGGGYATVRAMVTYPDFYKAGVSSAGNHDQRVYVAGWGERYIGLPDQTDYHEQANPNFAEKLKGKLLLVYADMDDNVHPAGTVLLVDALIKANKDFDLLLLPNRNHLYVDDPYLTRRRWDFFVRHLQNAEPPEGYEITGPSEGDSRG